MVEYLFLPFLGGYLAYPKLLILGEFAPIHVPPAALILGNYY